VPNVATDHANSFQAVAMRVGKLSAAGTSLTATGSAWTTNQFVSVGFTPTYQAGADLAQLAADGTLCADYRSPDMLRYVALSVAICNPEPELRQTMSGGTLLTPPPGTGAVTGYAAPDRGVIPTPNGVSLEVWSRAIVNANPYWLWIFPYSMLWPTGETTLENGLPALQFTGYGYGNPSWQSIDGAWPFVTDKAYAYARTATIPAITNGFN
jgi:hypothetical protein